MPFYFQETLGGSDINSERRLAAYDDYRFRGPNLLLLQESVEHSLWGPIGVFVLTEQGQVAVHRRDLGLTGLSTGTTLGLTPRAGGFPMVNLSFAWGGQAHHLIGAMNFVAARRIGKTEAQLTVPGAVSPGSRACGPATTVEAGRFASDKRPGGRDRRCVSQTFTASLPGA